MDVDNNRLQILADLGSEVCPNIRAVLKLYDVAESCSSVPPSPSRSEHPRFHRQLLRLTSPGCRFALKTEYKAINIELTTKTLHRPSSILTVSLTPWLTNELTLLYSDR